MAQLSRSSRGLGCVSLWERSDGGGLLSDPHTCFSNFPTPPLASELSLRTGLLSHFLRALTGCRGPPDEEFEQGLELPEPRWGTEPTDGGMLPSLHATE